MANNTSKYYNVYYTTTASTIGGTWIQTAPPPPKLELQDFYDKALLDRLISQMRNSTVRLSKRPQVETMKHMWRPRS
jgi:hypothetical protein